MCRSGKARTCDLVVPGHAYYQTVLHPERSGGATLARALFKHWLKPICNYFALPPHKMGSFSFLLRRTGKPPKDFCGNGEFTLAFTCMNLIRG